MLSGPLWGPTLYMVSMINMSKRYKCQVPILQQLSSYPAEHGLCPFRVHFGVVIFPAVAGHVLGSSANSRQQSADLQVYQSKMQLMQSSTAIK